MQSAQTKFMDQVEMQATLENIGKQVHNYHDYPIVQSNIACMND